MPSRREIDFRMWYEETLCLLDRIGIDIYVFLYIVCWLFCTINFSAASPHSYFNLLWRHLP